MNSTAPTCVNPDPQLPQRTSSPSPDHNDVTEEHVRVNVDLPAAHPDHLSDTSDDEDDEQEQVARPRVLSRRVKVILTSSLAVIFLICITFTVRNWSRYEERRFQYEWTEHSCVLRTKQIAQSPSEKDKYRIESTVNGLLPNRKEKKRAYYGPSDAYTLTKHDAEKVISSLSTGATSCWLKRSDTSLISLVEVSGAEDEVAEARSALYIAWTTTFIAAVVGMFTLIFASHWLNNFMGALGGGSDDGTSPEEMAKNKPFLSASQARHVCNVFSSDVKRDQAGISDWICSVCFEEKEEMATIRTVLLPCEHRFHRACIKKWLRRGKSACPLCKWEAKTLFDTEGKPSFSDERESGERVSCESEAGEDETDLEHGPESGTVS